MNTFIYIILALVAVCTICTVIVMVKVFSRQETTSDVSSKDFDRVEGKISEENRSAWQELSDIIDKLLQGLSHQTPRRLSYHRFYLPQHLRFRNHRWNCPISEHRRNLHGL